MENLLERIGDRIMKIRKKNRGFTLVEILIVVVILGILAAIVIPQFSNASQEANLNRLQSDLQTVRSQIQLYKIRHIGQLPTDANFEAWMTGYTNPNNTYIGNDAAAAATPGALGPYLQQVPFNPWGGRGINAVAPADGSAQGWTYVQATGAFNAVQGTAIVADVGDLTAF